MELPGIKGLFLLPLITATIPTDFAEMESALKWPNTDICENPPKRNMLQEWHTEPYGRPSFCLPQQLPEAVMLTPVVTTTQKRGFFLREKQDQLLRPLTWPNGVGCYALMACTYTAFQGCNEPHWMPACILLFPVPRSSPAPPKSRSGSSGTCRHRFILHQPCVRSGGKKKLMHCIMALIVSLSLIQRFYCDSYDSMTCCLPLLPSPDLLSSSFSTDIHWKGHSALWKLLFFRFYKFLPAEVLDDNSAQSMACQ